MIVSLSTLIFATLQIDEGSKIEISELTLEISQNRVVKLGQIASLILLIIFIIKMIPNTLTALKDSWLSRLAKIDGQERISLQYSWGQHEGERFDDSPQGESDALKSEQRYRRTNSEKFFERNLALTNTIASLLLDISLPLSLAVIAIFYPYFLTNTIQTDETQLFMLSAPSNERVNVEGVLEPYLTYGPKPPPHGGKGGG
jgi:hypothetical protein